MPEPIRIRFSGFNGIDFSSAERVRLPRPNAPAFGEQTVLQAGIATLAAAGNTKGRIAADALALCTGGRSLTLSGMIPRAHIPFVSDYTIAEGLTGGAGAGLAYGAGGGLYFWKKNPGFEIGLYGGLSVGMVTNIGAAGGVQIAYMFGPAPATLGGDSISVAVTVEFGPVSGSGLLFLSAPPGGFVIPTGSNLGAVLSGMVAAMTYTPTVIGVGIAATMGFSVLPVDVSVMPGRTWLAPVVTR